MDIAKQKYDLRETMKILRVKLKSKTPDAPSLISSNIPDVLVPAIATEVSSYLPIGSEIAPMILAQKLISKGSALSLPRLEKENGKIVFVRWNFGDPLEETTFSINQPLENSNYVSPELILVPLLAFDRSGSRLGYGKGHYDRAIKALRLSKRVNVFGVAFAGQEVAAIPTEPHDEKLDWVITEKEAIEIDIGN